MVAGSLMLLPTCVFVYQNTRSAHCSKEDREKEIEKKKNTKMGNILNFKYQNDILTNRLRSAKPSIQPLVSYKATQLFSRAAQSWAGVLAL